MQNTSCGKHLAGTRVRCQTNLRYADDHSWWYHPHCKDSIWSSKPHKSSQEEQWAIPTVTQCQEDKGLHLWRECRSAHCKNGVSAIDTSFVISFETCLFIDTKSYFMQDMFKGNVSMQVTHTQIMSSCKTLQFRKTCLLSLVGRHDLLKDMSSCLKMHFYCFYFLCFILLKTCLFPRHVLNMAPRHDFYSAGKGKWRGCRDC